MANLSKIKRDQLLNEIKTIENKYPADTDTLNTLNKLKQEITNKKYGLVWEEHSEKVDEMLIDNIPVFTEDKSREIVSDPCLPYNFLIEGDNLHALKLLEKTHKGKIDVIYIDPPYNTGNKDFMYDDDYVDKDDMFSHSKWLSFMRERLIIAKELLSKKGIILISIDSNEGFQLKLLLDSLFGEKNFIADFHVETAYVAGTRRYAAINGSVVKTTEFVLGYSKNPNIKPINNPKYDFILGFDTHYNLFYNKNTNSIENFIDVLKNNTKIVNIFNKNNLKLSLNNLSNLVLFNEEIKKWLYETDISTNLYRLSEKIDIPSSITNNITTTQFVYNKKYILKLNNDYFVAFRYSDRLGNCDDYDQNYGERSIRGNLWKGFSADGGNLNKEGDVSFKNGKKPIRLIKQLLDSVLDENKTDQIVLDFFAGSGTTGEAVLTLKNKFPNISFILCTNNENNICIDTTYKRLNTVISGIKQNGKNYFYKIPANLKYYKTDFIPKNTNQNQILSDQIDPDSGITEVTLCDKLQDHIRELVQLETHHDIDDDYYKMVLTDTDLNNLISNINNYPNLKEIYISSTILLDSNQKQILQSKNVKISEIPDYYFSNELKENGELW